MNKRTREERFFEKVSKHGCLIWLGARNAWGYGTFMWEKDEDGNGKNINASRAAWLLQKGEIPEGLDVLHTCHNRACVNVAHMYLGTDKDNAMDMIRAGSRPAKIKPEQVVEARKLLAAGVRGTDIAKRLGVSQGIISKMKVGKTFRWLKQQEPA